MKTIFEKIAYLKSRIALGGERKQEIRNQLLQRLGIDVSAHGLGRQQVRKPTLASVLMLFHIKPMPITALAGIVLALTAGISVASEASLPGDILYPVKVGINEEVRAAFTLGAANDARWDARRAERRLEEAARISAEGEIKAETRAKLESDFKGASGRVQTYVQQLRASGNARVAAEIAAELAAMLKAHESALIEIEQKGEQPKDAVKVLRQEVQEELTETAEIKASLDVEIRADATVSPSATPTRTASPKPILRLEGSTQDTVDLQLR